MSVTFGQLLAPPTANNPRRPHYRFYMKQTAFDKSRSVQTELAEINNKMGHHEKRGVTLGEPLGTGVSSHRDHDGL